MKNIQSSKDLCKNPQKTSLKGYYQSLPDRVAPKQQMLEELQRKCGERTGKAPTLTTVRNWVLYDIKPQNPVYIEVIVEVTGIKEEDLWED